MDLTLHRLEREIASCLHGLDAARTQLRPPSRPGKWSIQQIMEHLLLSYSGAEMALNARLVKGRPTQAKPNLMQRMGQYTVVRLGYFPTGRKAPALVMPAETMHPLSGEELAEAVKDHLSRLDVLCVEAEGLFGGDCRCASHMSLGPLSVDQWRRFQLIHGEHHLKQIVAIRRAHEV
jgi:Protein of unknown function (DUF1569)